MDQACKFIFIQRLLQIAEQWQVTFKGLVMQRRQFCLWKPAEQDGGLYKALATGDFNQLEPGQVGQTLVAQEDVEGRLGLRHQTDCLSGVFRLDEPDVMLRNLTHLLPVHIVERTRWWVRIMPLV